MYVFKHLLYFLKTSVCNNLHLFSETELIFLMETLKTAIMQPYFCSYIGYYQLIKSVDKFIIYDNIQYNKKGWFNRNRILLNGKDKLFTIPIKKDSDYLNVNERFLANESLKERIKILSIIANAYRKAPYFEEAYPLFEKLFLYGSENLFEYINNSVRLICSSLGIETEILVSSNIDIDHRLKAQNKVIEICTFLRSNTYVNAPGGKALYEQELFLKKDIELKFLEPRNICYKQFGNDFVPRLSIIDVMMFNGIRNTKELLEEYDLN